MAKRSRFVTEPGQVQVIPAYPGKREAEWQPRIDRLDDRQLAARAQALFDLKEWGTLAQMMHDES